MSTRIYNGFRFKGIRSLDKAFFLLRELRKPIIDEARQQSAKMVAESACFIYDSIKYYGNPNGDKSAFSTAYNNIWDELTDAKKERRNSYYDVGFDVSIAVTHDKTIIGMVFSNQILRKRFFEFDNVVEYAYWDNSDEPEGMSMHEWTKRRGHWNEVLVGAGVPAEDMLSMTIVPEYQMLHIETEDVERNIIPFERRLQKLAEEVTLEKAANEFKLDKPSDIIRFMMRTPEYTPMLEAEKERLRSLMKETITIKDLQEKL